MTNRKKGFSVGCAAALLVCLAVCLVLAGGMISRSIVYIEPDEAGVVLSPFEPGGYRREVLRPGLAWLRIGETVRIYKLSREMYVTTDGLAPPDPVETLTADGQDMLIDVSVLYRIDPAGILDLHIFWQDRYPEELVRPLIRSLTRETVRQSTAFELSANRLQIEAAVSEKLAPRLSENSLILLQYKILDIRRR